MNIAENLEQLLETKEAIRQAINTVGSENGEIESGTPFSAYSEYILAIDTSGGGGDDPGGGDEPAEPFYFMSLDQVEEYDGSTQVVGGGFETGYTTSFWVMCDDGSGSAGVLTPSSVSVDTCELDETDVTTGVTVTTNQEQITIEFADVYGCGFVDIDVNGTAYTLNVDVLPQNMYRIDTDHSGQFAVYPLGWDVFEEYNGSNRYEEWTIDIYINGTDMMNSVSPATSITVQLDRRFQEAGASTVGYMNDGLPYLASNYDVVVLENDTWGAVISAPEEGTWYFYNDISDVEPCNDGDYFFGGN